MELNYKTVVHCDLCNDTGLVNVERDGRQLMAYCVCDARRKTMLRAKRSGMDDSMAQFRFDNFAVGQDFQRTMMDKCRRFLEQDDRRFLYIGGQPGCGKTHIATAVCTALLDRGNEMLYVTFQELMNEMKSLVNESEYAQTVQRYGTMPLLYIDDFMKFEPTKSDIAHAFEVINLRMLKRKLTVITSERGPDEIVAIDEALGGRIKQMCGEFAIGIERAPGRDWRLRKQ